MVHCGSSKKNKYPGTMDFPVVVSVHLLHPRYHRWFLLVLPAALPDKCWCWLPPLQEKHCKGWVASTVRGGACRQRSDGRLAVNKQYACLAYIWSRLFLISRPHLRNQVRWLASHFLQTTCVICVFAKHKFIAFAWMISDHVNCIMNGIAVFMSFGVIWLFARVRHHSGAWKAMK